MPPKNEKPYLTRAESELMALLWKHGPSTVSELVARVDRGLAYTTVLTTVRILEDKGYVKHDVEGKAHRFRAALKEGQIRRRHLRDLVDRLFGGKAEHLLTSLIDDESMSADELRRLRAEIDQRLKERS